MTTIGILAEDQSDCDALSVLIRRIRVPKPGAGYKIMTRPTEGCSKLRRKGTARLKELAAAGCEALVVVHDLDRCPHNSGLNDIEALLSKLNKEVLHPNGTKRLFCIPSEELEAWFWSCQKTLDHVVRGTRIAKANHQPHKIKKPKEKLISVSCGANRKPIYSPNMNEELAGILDLEICAERCVSFRKLRDFVLGI